MRQRRRDSGTFLDEATRLLILIVALHPSRPMPQPEPEREASERVGHAVRAWRLPCRQHEEVIVATARADRSCRYHSSALHVLSCSGSSLVLRNLVSLTNSPSGVMSPSRNPTASDLRSPVTAMSPNMKWYVCGVIKPAGPSDSAASINRRISAGGQQVRCRSDLLPGADIVGRNLVALVLGVNPPREAAEGIQPVPDSRWRTSCPGPLDHSAGHREDVPVGLGVADVAAEKRLLTPHLVALAPFERDVAFHIGSECHRRSPIHGSATFCNIATSTLA